MDSVRTTARALALVTLYALHGASLAAGETTSAPPYWHGWHGWQGHGPGFWWFIPLVIIAVVFCFVFCRRLGGEWRPGARQGLHDPHDTVESAMDILDKRYARGEIDRQEYEEKKATISSSDR